MNLKYTIKSEIIVIAQENLDELLKVFANQDAKHQRNPGSIS